MIHLGPMSTFEELGIDSPLVEHLRGLGYNAPTPFQEDAVPAIARGTTTVGIASAGSGKTLAYALGLASRVDPDDRALQALVLRPTGHAAATAEFLGRVLGPLSIRARLLQPGRPLPGPVQIAAASPDAALAAVETSAIKLDGLKTLIIDGASTIFELGGGDALETLVGHVPKAAQRVFLTGTMTSDVNDWLERHARRARRVTDMPGEIRPLVDAQAIFYAAPRRQWGAVLIETLDKQQPSKEACVIHCRSQQDARQLEEMLSARGYDIGDGDRLSIVMGDELESAALSVSWGVPSELESLKQRVAVSKTALLLIEPDELAHLQRQAAALQIKLIPYATPHQPAAHRSAQRTREQLREAAATRDLEPYLLLLEPLMEDFTPAELAAAATSLLRERIPDETEPLPAWTRLYIGVGRRDSIRPGDLVGAITGEASIAGEQIGRIEIRENFSLVEVAAPIAEQVLESMAMATIRGRPAQVRVFRD